MPGDLSYPQQIWSSRQSVFVHMDTMTLHNYNSTSISSSVCSLIKKQVLIIRKISCDVWCWPHCVRLMASPARTEIMLSSMSAYSSHSPLHCTHTHQVSGNMSTPFVQVCMSICAHQPNLQFGDELHVKPVERIETWDDLRHLRELQRWTVKEQWLRKNGRSRLPGVGADREYQLFLRLSVY